jgi:DNA repair exonuclease SbcCD ATPase subunit
MESMTKDWLAWYPWVIAGVFALAALTFALLWTGARTKRREHAIRAFLDTADALERDLLECKRKMQDLEAWVASLPTADVRRVGFTLNAEASVNEARKLLLGQRIWLRDQHESASLNELQSANNNLDRSRLSLAEHMGKLEQMRGELERATDSLEDAYRTQAKAPVVVGGNSSVH